MRNLVATFITAILGAAGTVGYANSANTGTGDPLLVVGPVESVNAAHTVAVVLGQKVLIGAEASVAVGNTVAVYGEVLGDGGLNATKLVVEGAYVPGATPVFVSGTVQQVQPSIGRAVVSGITVDLTALMSTGAVTPAVGSKVEISGTQPVNSGLLVADGISGSGKVMAGISGSGLAMAGISGSGKATAGISGSGLAMAGISGSGLAMAGISGSGLAMAGISGSGLAMAGISGSGLAMAGISGSGKAMAGISGSGKVVAAGISGSGK